MNSNVNFYFLDGSIRKIILDDTFKWKTIVKNITQQTSHKIQNYNLYDINSGYCITKTLNHFKNYHWDRNSNIQIISSPDVLRILDIDIQYKNLRSSWNIKKMEEMFGQIEKWDTSWITDFSSAFSYSLCNKDISKWDVSNATNMKKMFYNADYFNQPLEKWDVGNVKDMSDMFSNAHEFNQPIGNWNVGNVTNMSGMFRYTHNFNQPLEKWNVSNVKDMSDMFWGTRNFNQPLDKWDVQFVVNMNNMFTGCFKFKQTLPSWGIQYKTNVFGMFFKSNIDESMFELNEHQTKKLFINNLDV